MITRAKMPRQLRNKGGIMTIGGGVPSQEKLVLVVLKKN